MMQKILPSLFDDSDVDADVECVCSASCVRVSLNSVLSSSVLSRIQFSFPVFFSIPFIQAHPSPLLLIFLLSFCLKCRRRSMFIFYFLILFSCCIRSSNSNPLFSFYSTYLIHVRHPLFHLNQVIHPSAPLLILFSSCLNRIILSHLRLPERTLRLT